MGTVPGCTWKGGVQAFSIFPKSLRILAHEWGREVSFSQKPSNFKLFGRLLPGLEDLYLDENQGGGGGWGGIPGPFHLLLSYWVAPEYKGWELKSPRRKSWAFLGSYLDW